MEYKICTKCHESKSLDEFHLSKGKYVAACKGCTRITNALRNESKKNGNYVSRYSQKHRQQQFLDKANAKWGDSYGYLKTVVGKHDEPVEIRCEKHSEYFKCLQRSHLEDAGAGCKRCSSEVHSTSMKMSQEDFITKCVATHGSIYDYSETLYNGWYSQLTAYCDKHKKHFSVMAGQHSQGQKCPVCAKESFVEKVADTHEDFMVKYRLVHGNKYGTDKLLYKSSTKKVILNCLIHGDFETRPTDLLSGSGCKQCGYSSIGTKNRASTAEWIAKAIEVHGDRYDYSKSVHIGKTTTICVGCKQCNNDFFPRPANHLNGTGCPNCVSTGYNKNKAGSIYVLQDTGIVKIGITNRNVKVRVKEINKDSGKAFNTVWFAKFEDGCIPWSIEWATLKYLRASYSSVNEKFSGSTECFHIENIEGFIKIMDTHKKIHEGYYDN